MASLLTQQCLRLRATLYWLVLAVLTIVIGIATLLTWPLPRRYSVAVTHTWLVSSVWLLKVICGVDYRLHGIENIPDRPFVMLANHQSAFECLIILRHFPSIAFVIKRELLWIPFFGWAFALLRPVAIDRSSGNSALKQVVDKGQQHLNNGLSIVVFPEGTRIAPDDDKPYRTGGAALAIEACAPVLPLAHNCGVFWPKGSFTKNPGTADVYIGQPIQAGHQTITSLNDQAKRWIDQHKQNYLVNKD